MPRLSAVSQMPILERKLIGYGFSIEDDHGKFYLAMTYATRKDAEEAHGHVSAAMVKLFSLISSSDDQLGGASQFAGS